jgi:S-methylmethionine-dependent homocysteine/selenocysteine methylase
MTIPAAPADRETRAQALLEALEERILVLDGATGTALQGYELSAADFGGAELEGCNENLCRTRPDVVRGVSEGYLAAGADVVETDSPGTPSSSTGSPPRSHARPARSSSARSACASWPARWARPRAQSR